jgi:hydroxymethylglutaryl-CoA lyase
VASEDVVYMLHGLGLATGIDLDALSTTGDWISKQLQRPNNSKAGLALISS